MMGSQHFQHAVGPGAQNAADLRQLCVGDAAIFARQAARGIEPEHGDFVALAPTFLDETWWILLVLLGAKMVLISLSFGLGFNGGMFVPSLVVGALAGSFFGVIGVKLGLDPVVAKVLVLVSLSSMATSIFGAPLTAAVLLFDLCDDQPEVLLPTLMASVICYSITQRTIGRSYFETTMGTRKS